MLNFCEINVARQMKSLYLSGTSLDTLSIQLGVSKDIIKNMIAEESNVLPKINGTTLVEFFRKNDGTIDRQLYKKVRYFIKQQLIDQLFFQKSTGTNNALNSSLQQIVRSKNRRYENDFNVIQAYFELKNKINQGNASVGEIGTYLMATNMPIIIQSWFPSIFEYNDGKYYFKQLHKLAEDWITKDQEDREPELNSMLALILEGVPIYNFNNNIPIPISNRQIVPKAFFHAVGYEIDNMDDKSFEKFIEDPYYIIDYLLTKYENGSPINPNNTMRSIVYKLFGSNGIKSRFLNNAYNTANDIANHPIDMIVAAFVKYRNRRFHETSTNGIQTEINANVENSEDYGRICDDVDQLSLSSYPSLFNNEQVISLNSSENAFYEAQILARKWFGYDYNIEDNMSSFELLLQFVNEAKKSKIKMEKQLQKAINGQKGADLLLNQLKISIQYLPNSISGTKDTKEGKAVAVFGVSSVANSIQDNLYRNRQRISKAKSEYSNAKVNHEDIVIITPVSPMEHTKLYQHKQKNENNIFTGTVYDVTLTAEMKGEEVTKHVNEMSTPEAFILSIQENFIRGWNSKGKIKNQAITPSDKSMIPKFEWDVTNLKDNYGNNNSIIEQKVLYEMQNIYKQILFNSISDLAQILQMRVDENGNIVKENALNEILEQLNKVNGNATQISIDSLLDIAAQLNVFMKQRQITDKVKNNDGSINENSIQLLLQRFRLQTGVYKDISNIHDYQIENGIVQLNAYSIMAINQFKDSKFIKKLYKDFLNDLKREAVKINDGKTAIDIAALLQDDVNAYNNVLYTYFLMNMVLSENILINTVGTAASHKHSFITEKSKNNLSTELFNKKYSELDNIQQKEVDNILWGKADSSAHLTMVKRMVALTATMHAGIDNVLSGMPNELRTMIIPNEVMQMFTYSGNSTSGSGWNSKFEHWDGTILGTRITSQLMKASTSDTKPEGMAEKLICHSQDPMKSSPELYKCANTVCDNANIRLATYEYVPEGYLTRNPIDLMKMQLDQASIKQISIDSKGRLLDYNGNLILFGGRYFTLPHGNIIYQINSLLYNHDTGKFDLIYSDENGIQQPIKSFENNLYSLWEALGGAWSCDKYGVYNEDSQDKIVDLINKLGTKHEGIDIVTNQKQVDQYLKHELIYYFVTESANKSLKSPVIDYKSAVNNPYNRVYNKVYLNNFGFQLDPNHSSEDSTIREISQLISFLAEDMLMPEHTRRIYQTIKNLLDTLNNKTFVDLDVITDYDKRQEARKKLDEIFGTRIKKIFADPNTDAMGLANEISKDLLKLYADPNFSIYFSAPFSDGQLLGKTHTTIGSQLNKYIARSWTGRADVLVPSHNMWMIYEDDPVDGELYGTTYMANDKIDEVSIGKVLHNKVWNEDGTMKNDYFITHIVQDTEVMPTDVYWKQVPTYDDNGNIVNINWSPEKIENWSDLVKVSTEIKNGAVYVKAIDLPRNLRSKQVFIDAQFINEYGEIINQRIGFYHLNSFKKLAALGIKLENSDYVNGETEESVLKAKKELQNEIEQKLLPIIYQGNVNSSILLEELEIPEGYSLNNISYICKDEERLTTNNYTNVFGIKNMNWSEISRLRDEYFYRSLIERFADIKDNDGLIVNYDILLYDSNGTPTAILFEKEELNLNNDPNYIVSYPTVDDDGYRLDAEGNKLYKWPEEAKLYIRKNGSIEVETIVINDLTSVENNSFTSTSLLDIIKEESFIFYRKGTSFNGKLNMTNLYELNDKTMENTLRNIAIKQYDSWVKSNDAIMARIPSQSLSFAMAIRTVGYLPYGNNITMVPASNTFLEGSDYDIDKAYAIMAALSHGGIYKEYGNSLTFKNNIENNDLSLELTNDLANIIFEATFANISTKEYISNKLNELLPKVVQIMQQQSINIDKNILEQLIISYLNDVNEGIISNGILANINNLINFATKELKHLYVGRTRLEKAAKSSDSAHLQNYMLETMLEIYRSPLTLMATTSPTTMDPVNDAVSYIGGNKALRSHFSPSSSIYVNQTTSVGKKDIGISAVAQKAFYVLNYYDWVRQQKRQSIFNFDTLELPEAWGGTKIISLGFPSTRIDENSLNLLYNTLVAYNKNLPEGKVNYDGILFQYRMDDNGPSIQYKTKDGFKLLKVNDRLGDFVVTTINSAIISSSTDNAKEMMMDLLNATPEVLPAYEYLLSIGVDLRQAATILTDDLLKVIITVTRGNLFNNEKGYYKVIDVLTKATALKKVKALYKNYNPEISDQEFNDKIDILIKLFKGAQELTVLGQTLGINQGMKVEFGEPLLYKLKFERQVNEVIDDNFKLDKFLEPGNDIYVEDMIQKYEEHKTKYNLLDIIYNVDHYRAMCRLPLQFKSTIQLLSKDVDTVYKIAESSADMHWNSDKLRTLLKVINDQKIFEFFKKYPFLYKSDNIYRKSGFMETNHNDDKMLSTATIEGLMTLKSHIEKVIWPQLIERYGDNEFVYNLVHAKSTLTAFGYPVNLMGSRIKLADPNNQDVLFMINEAFNDIGDEIIEDHTIYEWMYIYDLLVNKHSMSKNSISLLFQDHVNLADVNDINTKWVIYVNEYDSLFDTHNKYFSEAFKSVTTPKSKARILTPEEAAELEEIGDGSDNIVEKKSRIPNWAANPAILPLYVDVSKSTDILIDREELRNLFQNGHLPVKKC